MSGFNILPNMSRRGGAVSSRVHFTFERLSARIPVATDLSLKHVVTAPLPNARV